MSSTPEELDNDFDDTDVIGDVVVGSSCLKLCTCVSAFSFSRTEWNFRKYQI